MEVDAGGVCSLNWGDTRKNGRAAPDQSPHGFHGGVAGTFLWRAWSGRPVGGRPVVFLPGVGAHSVGRTPGQRALQRVEVLPLAGTFPVWLPGRDGSLREGITMEDLATEYADAIRSRFAGPVDVIGESTGGSVALQLAIMFPELVNRLVLVSAAARMGRRGQQAQRCAARSLRAGNRRHAAALLLGMTTTRPVVGHLLRLGGLVLGSVAIGRDDANLAALLEAEDSFDVRSGLSRVLASTLLIGGDRDGYYSPEIMDATALGLPQAVYVRLGRQGHLSVAVNATVRRAIRHHLQAPGENGNPATEGGR